MIFNDFKEGAHCIFAWFVGKLGGADGQGTAVNIFVQGKYKALGKSLRQTPLAKQWAQPVEDGQTQAG
ncbi:hypothetical protein [Pseudoalteromonas sp. T1lg76]|uniref:hypothetical protein n=1 Tax=Pseudoalteromonas sp. T1lg76 TaxID=2077103 RepID=UPI000CF68B7B|nr:hypothetical protein [Pseudoalteromonas sp. T1lg76]